MSDKIAAEMAEAEFERFVDEMDIDANTAAMDEEDRTQFQKQKSRMVRAIQKGALIITEDGEAIYTPQRSGEIEPIHFRERTGATAIAADGVKKGRDASKAYHMMADMAGIEPRTFSKLRGVDIKVCEAIFALLMD